MSNNSNCRTAVLLINLGTPDKPEEKEVREYLKEFLSDKDVTQLPDPPIELPAGLEDLRKVFLKASGQSSDSK